MNRSQFLRGTLAASALASTAWTPLAVRAQSYPARTVRVVVPMTPGGPSDIVARAWSQALAEDLKASFVVDNKPGASQIIGTQAVTTAVPDGYTLLQAASSISTMPLVVEHLPFDISRDSVAVSPTHQTPLVVVSDPKLPIKTIAELVRFGRGHPGKLSFGHTGEGNSQQLALRLLAQKAGWRQVNKVPYKGSSQAQPGPDRWPAVSGDRSGLGRLGPHPLWRGACPGRHGREPCGGICRFTDCGGKRHRRIRSVELGRSFRPVRHAPAHRRPHQPSPGQGPQPIRNRTAFRRLGTDRQSQLSPRIRILRQVRNGPLAHRHADTQELSMRHRILIQQGAYPAALEERLQHTCDARFLPVAGPHRDEVIAESGAEIEGITTSVRFGVDSALLRSLPKLKVVSSFGVGLDTIDVALAREHGIAVGYTPDVLTDCVADTAFALLMDVSRNVTAADRLVRRGGWPKCSLPPACRVSGKRLGILGLGRIGQAIACRAAGFDMDVRYHNRRPVAGCAYGYEPELTSLACWCDFLVIAAAGGADTRGLVSRPVLDALGTKGYLYQCGARLGGG